MRTLGLIMISCIYLFIVCEGDGNKYCVESCKEGEQERLSEHCYYWSTKTNTWDKAKKECEKMNGKLAAVTSMEIHNFLMRKVNKGNWRTWYWIGGSDKEKEGTWKWEDGSVWDFTNWASRLNQQPNNWLNQDCLQIYHSWATNGWNDYECNRHRQFICSWKICSGVT